MRRAIAIWLTVIGLLPGLVEPSVVAFDELDEIRKIEQQVQAVVKKNMPACVLVNDGTGFGSGVIVNSDGLVLTAAHVMESERNYQIRLPSGQTVEAKPLGKYRSADAGMLQITTPGDWPHVEVSETQARKGDWVVSLGHSGGFELGRTPPVRTGRVLGKQQGQLITDAVLIGGDSGGPLFNLEGELIGIHSSIGDTVALNRHVPVSAFRSNWERLLAGDAWGKLPTLETPDAAKRPGTMGVRVDLTAPNCRIRLVNPGSPAEAAGIQVDDVVVRFDSQRINNGQHLIETVKRRYADETYPIAVIRNGRVVNMEVTLK